MNNKRPVSRPGLLAIMFLALIILSGTQLANAQLLPTAGGANGQTTGALDALIEEARKDGSTIIVVKPRDANAAAEGNNDEANRSERFFRARARTAEIFASAPSLWAEYQGNDTACQP